MTDTGRIADLLATICTEDDEACRLGTLADGSVKLSDMKEFVTTREASVRKSGYEIQYVKAGTGFST
jgi:hypothetical protein